MFLDDELLKICEGHELSKSNTEFDESINELNEKLCGKCDDYHKSFVNEKTTPSDIKTVLDLTFNLWDSFVESAKKSNKPNMRIFVLVFSKNTYKEQFLSNAKMSKLYNEL